MSEGKKFDQDKVRYELIPPELLEGVASILTFGAIKYGDRNWEGGMKWGRIFGALMRHMWAWWRGEVADPETGKSHLWHAGCCLAFLIAYEARGAGEDDRPAKPMPEHPSELACYRCDICYPIEQLVDVGGRLLCPDCPKRIFISGDE